MIAFQSFNVITIRVFIPRFDLGFVVLATVGAVPISADAEADQPNRACAAAVCDPSYQLLTVPFVKPASDYFSDFDGRPIYAILIPAT